ncbi:hypothetical protein [Azotobacter chroococcum]|uniref:Uncharacterized protein n=1 Tax=Azotobacter chroococcum TaxID=353 RepID=A0AAP9Y8V9_9GAMM|nr:hypothetical protein [Azotobacter chroococcum]QQE86930.1 hypothetical protein GKQ51_11320 [Azotobacter chroococcum]
MVVKIDARPELKELSRAFSELGSKQLLFAMALAATRMAQRIKKGELSVMRRRLDNPIQQTLNSLYVKAATKQNLQAHVWFKDQWSSGIPADRYLQPVVQGGTRRHKRFERALIARGIMRSSQYATPTPALLDSHGNVKGSMIMKILSGLGAAETVSGYQANASSSRRSRKKGNAHRFFAAEIEGTMGVWERRSTAWGDAVRPVFVFVDRSPRYRVRFPFFQVAENMVKANYADEFRSAIDYALATANR